MSDYHGYQNNMSDWLEWNWLIMQIMMNQLMNDYSVACDQIPAGSLLDILYTTWNMDTCLLCFMFWYGHQMETFSTLLAICAGNSPVTGEFPAQRPVTQIFDVFFDLRLNKRLSKQSWGWGFETLSRPLWRHCNVLPMNACGWFTAITWLALSYLLYLNQDFRIS